MVRFREHRGQLEDALKTVHEISTKAELAQHIRNYLSRSPQFRLTDDELIIEPYVLEEDTRCGWKETWIVYRDSGALGWGVFGFTDGPLI
jgi:hypothetical protein